MRTVEVFDRFGTELRDIDLRSPLAEEDVAIARSAYESTHLIMVRGQKITFEEYARFVSYFWPFKTDEKGEPWMTAVSNVDVRGRTGRGVLLYHQDDSFLPMPCRALSLYANQASDTSAPTSFVSAVSPVRSMEPVLRQRLEELITCQIIDVHCTDGDSTYRIREADLPPDADAERFPRTHHPVLYPLGGADPDEKVLFVSEHQTSHIVGLSLTESEELLQHLFGLLYAEANTFIHYWQPHDILVWNNIALQHGRPEMVGDGPRDFWRLKSFAA
jgi:taurine dioxygenase